MPPKRPVPTQAERARLRKIIEERRLFTVAEFADAYGLIYETARSRLRVKVKNGEAHRIPLVTRDTIFYVLA